MMCVPVGSRLKESVSGMPGLSTRTVADQHRSVVLVSGECDMNTGDELTAALVAAVEQSPVVAVDLSALIFMDSSGIHALVTAHQRATVTGCVFYVTGATGVV